MPAAEHPAPSGSTVAPWALAEAWGGQSRLSDLDGPVHWVDFGGVEGSTPIVLVHGLGGSHLNWVSIAPALAAHTRVYALDLAGFGLTAGAGRATTVTANAALLHRFVTEVVGAPVVLVGNSMGGMISLLEAAAHPDAVAGLALIDPSVPVQRPRPRELPVASQFLLYAVPYVGKRYLVLSGRRLTDRQRVQRIVDLCFADPSRASGPVLDAATRLVAERRGMGDLEAQFLEAARSLLRVLAMPRRYESVMTAVGCPVLLVHGELDRLVPVRAARKVAADHPTWETVILPGVGHTPQLEVPDQVVEHLVAWLERQGLVLPARRGKGERLRT